MPINTLTFTLVIQYQHVRRNVICILNETEKFNDYLTDYDLIILPGGVKALEKLRQEQQVLEFIKSWNNQNKIIGCICHGAQLLISSKITNGRDVSGYYSIKDDIINEFN